MEKPSSARLLGIPVDRVYAAKEALKQMPGFGAIRPAFDAAKRGEAWLRAKGFVVRPLVPEAALGACQETAVRRLLGVDPGHRWGDYLEFGVFQGHSLSTAYATFQRLGLLDRVRLYGFDSFEGYPAAAADEPNGYQPGGDRAEMHVAERLLARRGVDRSRVKLVKGWFSQSLTPELRAAERIERASVVNFDCDLYSSTAEALAFVRPLVGRAAVFLFDDWGPRGLDEEMTNQKRAFVEYLEADPTIAAEQLPGYSSESVVFLLTRSAAGGNWHERVRRLA